MILRILFVITIILQFFAVGVAIKLIRVTKYNSSWMLLTIGFILMAITRLVEFLPYISEIKPQDTREIFVWGGLITSLSFAIGVFLIQKIFKYMKRVEESRRLTEKMFLNTIIQTEEKERKRFAKDLHDGLGPLLSSVKMSVSSLAQMKQDEASREIIENTELVINEAIKSIKEISDNLSPHVLSNFGLVRALSNFINKINIAKTLRINLITNLKDERFDANVEVVLYRVICELINNTIKHAQAKKINISLSQEGEYIQILYKDDGKGFDVSKIVEHQGSSGMGFSNIYSRINSLKGEINIESENKKGTQVTIKVLTNDQ
jgi:signal transduction histidine kinase